MLILSGGESIYFFSKLCLYLASDIFFYLLNVGLRRIQSEFYPDSFFENAILIKFSYDQLKFAVRDTVVGKGF